MARRSIIAPPPIITPERTRGSRPGLCRRRRLPRCCLVPSSRTTPLPHLGEADSLPPSPPPPPPPPPLAPPCSWLLRQLLMAYSLRSRMLNASLTCRSAREGASRIGARLYTRCVLPPLVADTPQFRRRRRGLLGAALVPPARPALGVQRAHLPVGARAQMLDHDVRAVDERGRARLPWHERRHSRVAVHARLIAARGHRGACARDDVARTRARTPPRGSRASATTAAPPHLADGQRVSGGARAVDVHGGPASPEQPGCSARCASSGAINPGSRTERRAPLPPRGEPHVQLASSVLTLLLLVLLLLLLLLGEPAFVHAARPRWRSSSSIHDRHDGVVIITAAAVGLLLARRLALAEEGQPAEGSRLEREARWRTSPLLRRIVRGGGLLGCRALRLPHGLAPHAGRAFPAPCGRPFRALPRSGGSIAAKPTTSWKTCGRSRRLAQHQTRIALPWGDRPHSRTRRLAGTRPEGSHALLTNALFFAGVLFFSGGSAAFSFCALVTRARKYLRGVHGCVRSNWESDAGASSGGSQLCLLAPADDGLHPRIFAPCSPARAPRLLPGLPRK